MSVLDFLDNVHLPPGFKNPEEDVQNMLESIFAYKDLDIEKDFFYRKEKNRTKYIWPYFRLDRFYKDIMSNITYPVAYEERIFGWKTYEVLELLRMFKQCNVYKFVHRIEEFDPENLITKAYVHFYNKILNKNVQRLEVPFLYKDTIYYHPLFLFLDYNTKPLFSYDKHHKTLPYVY